MIIPDKDIVDARLAICTACDKQKDMSENPLYFFVDALGKLVADAPKTLCTECDCPIWVKVRFISNSCPLKKWAE